MLDIIDKNGKWWQARKDDGTLGSTLCRIHIAASPSLLIHNRSRTVELSPSYLMDHHMRRTRLPPFSFFR